MQTQKTSLNVGIITLIIAAAAFSRLLFLGNTSFYNFAPFGAIALFGAAHFSRKWLAVFIPVAATWISDLYVNNVTYAAYNPEFTWFTSFSGWSYAAYLLTAIMGIFLFTKLNVSRVGIGAVLATAIFFLVSNFGSWLDPLLAYPQTASGLKNAYVAGIPFIKGTALGNIAYSVVLFGGFVLVQKLAPAVGGKKLVLN